MLHSNRFLSALSGSTVWWERGGGGWGCSDLLCRAGAINSASLQVETQVFSLSTFCCRLAKQRRRSGGGAAGGGSRWNGGNGASAKSSQWKALHSDPSVKGDCSHSGLWISFVLLLENNTRPPPPPCYGSAPTSDEFFPDPFHKTHTCI